MLFIFRTVISGFIIQTFQKTFQILHSIIITAYSCVSDLIREGRAALMTSFGMFKYMALYSMIQFCSILILYWRKSNLSDMEYLYIDLLIIDLVALTMSLNKAYKTISQTPPPRALVTAPTGKILNDQIGH